MWALWVWKISHGLSVFVCVSGVQWKPQSHCTLLGFRTLKLDFPCEILDQYREITGLCYSPLFCNLNFFFWVLLCQFCAWGMQSDHLHFPAVEFPTERIRAVGKRSTSTLGSEPFVTSVRTCLVCLVNIDSALYPDELAVCRLSTSR